MFSEVSDFSSLVQFIFSEGKLGYIVGIYAFYYVNGSRKSEHIIAHIEEREEWKAQNKLEKRITTLLSDIDNELYGALEKFVFTGGAFDRRLTVVKKYKHLKTENIAANEYLRNYHGELRDLFDRMVETIVEELEVHNVKTLPEDDLQEQDSALAVRKLLLNDIRNRAGTNEDITRVENGAITYELILSLYKSVCKYSRNLHSQKVEQIENDTEKLRLPLVPNVKKLFGTTFQSVNSYIEKRRVKRAETLHKKRVKKNTEKKHKQITRGKRGKSVIDIPGENQTIEKGTLFSGSVTS